MHTKATYRINKILRPIGKGAAAPSVLPPFESATGNGRNWSVTLTVIFGRAHGKSRMSRDTTTPSRMPYSKPMPRETKKAVSHGSRSTSTAHQSTFS